ncbi:MAG: hypothetical protein ACI9FJ_001688 [Alteromonadaceae bacterium]|jgi:uncharacterized protein (DUF952 family)
MVSTAQINTVLRSDVHTDLVIGHTYIFKNSPAQQFFDSTPIWLSTSDWTALAQITILSQTLENHRISGQFRVDYVYQGQEQQVLSDIFIRMYSGICDPYIYLLGSQSEYDQSIIVGALERDSLYSEGFIHASPASQLNRVANKHYRDVVNPLLIMLDISKIDPQVKWEPATGGLYPHIFGPVNIDAVAKIQQLSKGRDGSFTITVNRES